MEDKLLLRQMCEAIQHRGPDKSDYFVDKEVSLGIDRLSIIDLVTGDQPIHNEDGTIQIAYNGEIYNYLELKAELEKAGHSFYTQSDTETVIHGYEEWGQSVVTRLRGMFAFALWDSGKKKLFMARDRFGKKPLYYAKIGGVFFFASELKAMMRYENFPREIDQAALDHYFTYLYVPSPSTIFLAAKKLPPGHYLTYERGEIKVSEYWDLKFNHKDERLIGDALIDRLYEKLVDAVKVRLRSDVPLGAFLSGGIDSSVVVALMKRAGMDRVKTFSIGFHEESYNELRYAREVAEFLGTEHVERSVEPDVISLLPKLIWQFDEPFADSSMIPSYLVAQETRREVKVALTGDGGDEIFLGYPFMFGSSIYAYYKRVPKPVRKAGLGLVARIPIQSKTTKSARQALIKDYGNLSENDRYFLRASHFDGPSLRNLYSQGYLTSHQPVRSEAYFKQFFDRASGLAFVDAVDYVTIKTYLPEDILTKVDRMTMAMSLEGRCPLLDQSLAEFVAQVPVRERFAGKVMKSLLKRTASKYNLVPRTTLTRAKHGFGTPIDYWLRGQWKDMASAILSPARSRAVRDYLADDSIRKLLSDPFAHRDRLFAVLSFALWHEMCVDSSDRTPYLQVRL